ncbi:hypothetical protein J6590_015937 [Homalodisca vitripennis]|nr:hypothetical protein J6590_015937 [Homalodisca vitripennis]
MLSAKVNVMPPTPLRYPPQRAVIAGWQYLYRAAVKVTSYNTLVCTETAVLRRLTQYHNPITASLRHYEFFALCRL